ncbi:SpoIIE family protein phosphatase [Leptospira harrisiae]|uniref:Stage II sporulation protein E n=1 Tax=Leptospira harrisiae TaxID=2023189 RepID=A0A2N0AP86_9LEPT|nr:SpoIIE family protein phosphatase [Leptospira harrisiae]PJZ86107.1 stage II sporulation protein E [Leptospira harrisiae]PKA09670.1 stage II sporulation protein E [Leptospira harrisiae]
MNVQVRLYMIKSIFIFLVFSFSLLHSQTFTNSTTKPDGSGIVSLDTIPNNPDTLWFMSEEDLTEAEIQSLSESNFNTKVWKQIAVPGNLYTNKEDYADKKIVTLAKWIQFPLDHSTQYSFRLGVINDRDRTYLNGKFIGGTGEWNATEPQAYDKLRFYNIPSEFIHYGKKNLLLIKIQPYFGNSGGIEQDETSLGPTNKVNARFYKDEFIKLLFLTIYSTVGGYFLFLFIRRRKDRENLFFALFSFSFVVYNFLRNQLKYEFAFSFLEMKKLEYMTILLLIPFMYHFLRTLFEEKYNVLGKILDVLQLFCFLYFAFTQNIETFSFLLTNFVQPTWLLYVVLIFVILFKNLRKKERRAVYITIGITIVLFAAVVDTATNRNYWVFPRIMGYTFLVFNISLAIILANSFVKLNEEVEDLNKNLEKKVEERTDALNESLNQLQILKEKQDGDYFLTSLLIQPLARIDNQIPEIQIETYVNQKKKFHFRGKDGEIGGDICIVGTVHLELGEFTVFANGDAMGKSIQGAGGALVLGVVFQAVLSRAKSSYTKSRPPELWLKDLYVELQSVFVSFDGSMLSSVVLGMVGKDGFVYYINAEHPWSILYRDGVASFIETELSMRKLGFPKNDHYFQTKTFQLEPGDTLLIGSDGRDDIGFFQEENSIRTINEDETLILRFVERSKTELSDLVHEIEMSGEITDDLSFLKIHYSPVNRRMSLPDFVKKEYLEIKSKSKQGEYQNALEQLQQLMEKFSHPNFYAFAGKLQYQLKNWKDAIQNLKLATKENPMREDYIFMTANALHKNNQPQEAVIWCERLFLRNKFHKQNTKLFLYLLDLTKNIDKKEFYLEFLSTNKV